MPIEHWKSGDWYVIRVPKGQPGAGQFVARTQLFYRYTYAVMFSYHKKYYSVVGQVWSVKPNDAELEAAVKSAVMAEVKGNAGGFDPDEWGGLVVVADSMWEPVSVDAHIKLASVDVRTEFKGKRTWKRQIRKSRE